MSFAMIRGRDGRRHEVDFGDAAVEVDVAIGSETVQIAVGPSALWRAVRQTTNGGSPPLPSGAESSRQLWAPT